MKSMMKQQISAIHNPKRGRKSVLKNIPKQRVRKTTKIAIKQRISIFFILFLNSKNIFDFFVEIFGCLFSSIFICANYGRKNCLNFFFRFSIQKVRRNFHDKAISFSIYKTPIVKFVNGIILKNIT